MDRQLLGILLLVACLAILAVIAIRVRHNSPHRVYRRSRLADEAKWAARARKREEEG